MVPQVQYHRRGRVCTKVVPSDALFARFSVNFRSGSEGKLIFTLSAEEPSRLLCSVLCRTPQYLRTIRTGWLQL